MGFLKPSWLPASSGFSSMSFFYCQLGAFPRRSDAPLPSWILSTVRSVNAADHSMRRRGRSRTDERQARWKATVRESRRTVSTLEPLRRFPEGREEETVGRPPCLARCPGRRMEAGRRRLLRLVRTGVRVLAQDGRRAEGLTPRALALRCGLALDLPDQPCDELPIHLRAEVTPA